jgi:hypothetical protein
LRELLHLLPQGQRTFDYEKAKQGVSIYMGLKKWSLLILVQPMPMRFLTIIPIMNSGPSFGSGLFAFQIYDFSGLFRWL